MPPPPTLWRLYYIMSLDLNAFAGKIWSMIFPDIIIFSKIENLLLRCSGESGIGNSCTPQICTKCSKYVRQYSLCILNSIETSGILLKYAGVQQTWKFSTPHICGVNPLDSRLVQWMPSGCLVVFLQMLKGI